MILEEKGKTASRSWGSFSFTVFNNKAEIYPHLCLVCPGARSSLLYVHTTEGREGAGEVEGERWRGDERHREYIERNLDIYATGGGRLHLFLATLFKTQPKGWRESLVEH